MNWNPKKLFQGRIRRFHFLVGVVFINLVMGLFLAYYYSQMRFDMYKTLWGLFAFCIFFLTSLMVRRFHDIDRSGWWALLFFIPFFNFILLIYLLIYPGNREVNSYGDLEGRGAVKSILNIKK